MPASASSASAATCAEYCGAGEEDRPRANFLFHPIAAYAILRHAGVVLGEPDVPAGRIVIYPRRATGLFRVSPTGKTDKDLS